MQNFIDKKYDVLVSTTIIEVGVDVPNASVMVIESPQRFGLAQIHQLRGRVGRGSKTAQCYLMLSDDSPPSKRLQALERFSDGFKLAELDLQIRGPGVIYGTKQHGKLDLRMASLTDSELIKNVQKAVKLFTEKHDTLLQYPVLQQKISKLQHIVHLN